MLISTASGLIYTPPAASKPPLLSPASVPALGFCLLDDSDCVVAEIESLDLVCISLMAKDVDHFHLFIAHLYFFT